MRRNDSTIAGLAGSVVATQAKIGKPDLDVLFMCAAQRRDFYLELAQEIDSRLFSSEGELAYEVLWIVLGSIFAETDEVTPVSFAATVGRALQGRGSTEANFLNDVLLGRGGYHEFLFQAQTTSNDCDISRAIARRFLLERRVETPLRRVLSSAGHNSPTDLQSILETATRDAAKINSMVDLPVVAVSEVYGEELPPPMAYESTGLGWLDRRIIGQVRGTCNAILGPTGGGKTTFAVTKAVASARQAYIEAQQRTAMGVPTTPELVVIVTAEEAAALLKPRLQSAAFSIPRRTLEGLTDWRDLSSAEVGPKEYERALTEAQRLGPLQAAGGIPQVDVLSEKERYQLHSEWFNQCCVVVDLSGSAEHPNAGNGFIPEIAAILRRLSETRGQRIREVIIDWAGAVCERFIQQNPKLSLDHMRHLLNIFGDQSKREIAINFNCVVWVTHQLKAALGKAMPSKLMHHTDAAESAAFAVRMATVGCLGTEDKRTGVRMLNFSKTRLVESQLARPTCLMIHPLFCELIDVTDTYTIDHNNGQIVSSNEARQIGGFNFQQEQEAADE
jgi:hypothetical protein